MPRRRVGSVKRRPDEFAVIEEPIERIADLAEVPTAFLVDRRFAISELPDGRERFVLREESVHPPYTKDYDATESGGPADWGLRFDLSTWGLLVASAAGGRIGGAVVAIDTPGVDMLESRRDLSVLWDLRVTPAWRRAGVGKGLFRAAETWARKRGCVELKVETQDINVPACHLYHHLGCELTAIDRTAYPGLDEVQMIWRRQLG